MTYPRPFFPFLFPRVFYATKAVLLGGQCPCNWLNIQYSSALVERFQIHPFSESFPTREICIELVELLMMKNRLVSSHIAIFCWYEMRVKCQFSALSSTHFASISISPRGTGLGTLNPNPDAPCSCTYFSVHFPVLTFANRFFIHQGSSNCQQFSAYLLFAQFCTP